LERVGGVQATQRLSELQVVRNTVNQLTMDLQTGAPPKRQAPVLPLAMIAALEITVCDVSCSLYLRGFAFHKLLKLWAVARHSDLEGLDPSSLVLTVQGLEGRLDRTKTSGPGRRVRFLPIFISRAAFLLRPEWLATGVEIWNHANMAFERDYFLPLPTADWKGCLKSMASYSRPFQNIYGALCEPLFVTSSHGYFLNNRCLHLQTLSPFGPSIQNATG